MPMAIFASNPIADSYQSETGGTSYYVFDENGVGAIIRSRKPPKAAKPNGIANKSKYNAIGAASQKTVSQVLVVSEKEYKAGKQYNNSSMSEAQASRTLGIPAKRIAELGVSVNVIDAGLEKQTLVDKRSNAPSTARPSEQSITDALVAAGIKTDKVNLNELPQVGAFWCKTVIESTGGKVHGSADLKKVLGVIFGPKFPSIEKAEILVRTKMVNKDTGKDTGLDDLLRVKMNRPKFGLPEDGGNPLTFLKKLKMVAEVWEHHSVRED